MLNWSEDGIHLFPVGRGDSLELPKQPSEQRQAICRAYLTDQDRCPKAVHFSLHGHHVLSDSILNELKCCYLVLGKAELILELQGQRHVFAQPWPHPVQPQPTPATALLGRKQMSSP